MKSRAILFAILFVAGCGKRAETLPPAATPEEALQRYEKALGTGNVDLFLAVLAEGPRQFWETLLVETEAQERALEELNKAMDEKFGPDPQRTFPVIKHDHGRVLGMSAAKLELLERKDIDGDHAQLKVKTTRRFPPEGAAAVEEEVYDAVREEGGWKIIPPGYDSNDATAIQAKKGVDFLARHRRVQEEVAKDIRKGLIRDRMSAFRRLSEGFKQSREAK